MKYLINVIRNGYSFSSELLSFGNYQRLEFPFLFIIDVFKYHNHRYDLHAFFYNTKLIVPTRSYSSKRELYGAIQDLIQEQLNVDVQF